MSRALTITALFIVGSFAGCLDTNEGQGASGAKSIRQGKQWAEGLVGDLVAGDPLWLDPQNAPHPAFGWPTLSNPVNASEAVSEFWRPIEAKALPSPLRGMSLLSKSPEGVTTGRGIAIYGSIVVVPGNPTALVDIRDPAKPVKVGELPLSEGMQPHRGATIIAYPDGRVVTVIATSRALDVWDITDPRAPVQQTPIWIPSHKVGVVPGTPLVYNAASSGGGAPDPASQSLGGRTATTGRGFTGIYDLTDPMNPQLVKNWTNGFACHHIYFWNNAAEGKFRGLCAGIQYTQIWDMKDPLNPTVIVNVPVHHGVANSPSGSTYGLTPSLPVPVPGSTFAFSHYAGLSNDGKILLVGDENMGGGGPPGCVASVNTPQGAVSTPVGALWFYDVSNERNPRLLGWYAPLNDPRVKSSPTASCTAHHGRMVPVPGRSVIAMSFYGAGVLLVDFTGLGTPSAPLPKVIDQYAGGTNVWETWYNQGYLFTGDGARGMDVLAFR